MSPWYRLGGVFVALVASVASCSSEDPAPVEPAPVEDAAPPVDGGTPRADAGGDPLPDAGTDAGTDAAPAPDPDPSVRSGSRLRRRHFEAGPGASMALHLFDTELDVPCEFKTASDGALRCLPRAVGLRVYADAACTDPAVLTVGCHHPTVTEPEEQRVFRVKTEKVGATKYYRQRSGGACEEESVYDFHKLWATPEEVPTATLVRGTVEDEPRMNGMSARYVAGQDGSRELVSVHDTNRGDALCVFDREEGRCVPSRLSRASNFSDTSCTMPVSAPEQAPPDLLYESRFGVTNCLEGHDYFSAGAPLPAGTRAYFRNAAGTCTQLSEPPSASRYYPRGAPVPLSALPATKIVTEGTGRVRAQRRADLGDTALGRAHAFWDSDRDAPCSPARFPDGSYRCVPPAATIADFPHFTDAACSTPLVSYSLCSTTDRYVFSGSDLTNDCELFGGVREMNSISERGSVYEGDLFYRSSSSGPCQPASGTPRSTYYGIGPMVAPTAFPKIELKIE